MARGDGAVDSLDRKILGELSRNSDLSFTDLGERVGLSAPATHERVKKLKSNGTIKKQIAVLDAAKIGKPLLAFVHVITTGWGKTPELMALERYPEVEELHTVTGDACLILKVRVANSEALEDLLALIYNLPGVRSTKSYVALSSYIERGIQAEISDQFE